MIAEAPPLARRSRCLRGRCDEPRARRSSSSLHDAQGFRDARRDLKALVPANEKEKARTQWISGYLDKVDQAYGKPDANGMRWLRATYRQRCDSKGKPAGRHEARVSAAPLYDQEGNYDRYAHVCLQHMLRELRGYAVGPSARSCPAYRRRERVRSPT